MAQFAHVPASSPVSWHQKALGWNGSFSNGVTVTCSVIIPLVEMPGSSLEQLHLYGNQKMTPADAPPVAIKLRLGGTHISTSSKGLAFSLERQAWYCGLQQRDCTAMAIISVILCLGNVGALSLKAQPSPARLYVWCGWNFIKPFASRLEQEVPGGWQRF